MQSLFCSCCGTSWVPWCSQPLELADVPVGVSALQCGSDEFPVTVPANSSAGSSQGAAKSTCFQPWQEVCCAVTDTRLQPGRLWFSRHRAETPVCGFDVFLSQVMLFLKLHCQLRRKCGTVFPLYCSEQFLRGWLVNPGPLQLGLPAWNRKWKSVKLLELLGYGKLSWLKRKPYSRPK